MEKLSDEERVLLEQLGLIRKKKNPVIPTQFKVIKGTVHCKLCDTTTVQLIKMMKVDDCWIKKEEIPVTEECGNLLDYEEYETEVRLCWACKDKLMIKTKEELIEMLIQLLNPVMARQEIWKSIKKAKEERK